MDASDNCNRESGNPSETIELEREFVDCLDIRDDVTSPSSVHSNDDDDGNESNDNEDDYHSTEEQDDEQQTRCNDEQQRLLECSLTEEEILNRLKLAKDLKQEGNQLFKDGEYKKAIKTYTESLKICPFANSKDRSILYSNRAACHMRLEAHDSAIKDSSKALEIDPVYLKALLRRAELYDKTEKLDEALSDYQKVLEIDPSQHCARAACMRLPDQIKERNDKMKEEMLGKLKDLGNMVLKPFGLSTNNFQMQQDPDSGSYSIKFNQNGH